MICFLVGFLVGATIAVVGTRYEMHHYREQIRDLKLGLGRKL